jgi:hypothetical protein
MTARQQLAQMRPVATAHRKPSVRRDKWEQQADEAARRVLRGDRGVARMLTPAPAAAYKAPLSRAETLPAHTRQALEQSFGADLTTVRIHRDAVASAVTQQHHAAAFTSGSELFFKAGRFDPTTEAGRYLLAHEIAHVLQQVGRVNAAGELRATEGAGVGHVQLAPDGEPDEFLVYTDQVDLFDSPLSWDEVSRAYADVTDVETHIATIDSHRPTTGPGSLAQRKELAAETRTPAFRSLSVELKGLYVDALKVFGDYDTAATVLLANPSVPTSFRSRRLYETVRARGLGWITRLASTDSFAKTYYPDRLVEIFGMVFLTPGLAPPDLDPTAKPGVKVFESKVKAELAKPAATMSRRGNELRAAMLAALYVLDFQVKSLLRDQIKELHGADSDLAEVHRELSIEYATQSSEQLYPSHYKESRQLFSGLFKGIQEQATTAAKFWNRSFEFRQALQNKTGFDALNFEFAEVRAIAERVRTDPHFKRLPDLLAQTGTHVFARPGGKLPGPGEFARRVEQQMNALQGEAAAYAAHVRKLIGTGHDADPEGLALGLAMLSVLTIHQVLARYNRARDVAFTGKARGDERIATRIRLARALALIADRFKYDNVRRVADGVYREGVQVALLSPWVADAPVQAGDLSRQLRPELFGFEGTGISGALLDRYAFTQYYRTLTDEITTRLAEPGRELTRKAPVLTDAIVAAKKTTRLPRRFVVRDWEVGNPALASGATPDHDLGRQFLNALWRQQPTVDLLAAEKKTGDLPLAPAVILSPPSWGPLFLWFVPRWAEFAELVAGLAQVRKVVEDHWKGAQPKLPPPDPYREPLRWMDALSALARELDARVNGPDPKASADAKKTLAAISSAITGAVETEFVEAEKSAKEAARQAVNDERNYRVHNVLWPLLLKYNRSDLRTWDIPNQVYGELFNFGQLVWPPEDQVLQVSAMTLELAAGLSAAFGPREGLLGEVNLYRLDVVDWVLMLSEQTLRVWDAGQSAVATSVAARRAVPLNPIATISSLSQAQLQSRAGILRQLRDSLAKQAETEQKRYGIHGDKSAQTLSSVFWEKEGLFLIKWNMETTLKPGSSFLLHGDQFLIVSVNETFTFHPGFGRGSTLGIRWTPGAPLPGAPKLLDAANRETKPSGQKLFTVSMIPNTGDPVTFEVTDDTSKRGLGSLAWITGILEEHFSFEYMAAAGVTVEKYINLLLDVVELFPGIGQGVAAARFAATILNTIASPEFQYVLKAFSEDGFGAFEKMFDAFPNVLHVEELANVLIFKSDFVDNTKKHQSLHGNRNRQEKVKSRGGPWARIGGMLKNVIELGLRILDRLKRLVMRVETPVRDAQLWVLSHPIAALVVDYVASGIEALDSLSIDGLAEFAQELMGQDWQRMIRNGVIDAAQNVVNRVRAVFDTLRFLELPERVIHLDGIVDIVIDLAVESIGKYRKGVQAVRGVLRTIGLWDKVVGAITSGLYKAGLDPNRLYVALVRDKLEPWLEGIRDGFVEELANVLGGVPFIGPLIADKGEHISLDLGGVGFPEAERYRAPGHQSEPTAPISTSSMSAAAAPLSRAERLRAGSTFGQDFSHVRLHRGDAGDRVTRAYGADAITTGSHVFLRPGIRESGAAGRHVLTHELAHVVQQTGPRPLSAGASDTPVLGQPGRGLNWDAGREAAAEHAAELGANSNISSSALTAAGPIHGLQPAGLTHDFLRSFLHHLHSASDLREARDKVAEERKGVALDPELQQLAKALVAYFHVLFSENKAKFAKPFSTVSEQLNKFLRAQWPEFKETIPLLVSRAHATIVPPKSDKDDQTPQEYEPPERLKVQLERELYGLTGMAFDIVVNQMTGSASIKGKKTVNPSKPIASVAIVYLHMPLVPAGADGEALWNLVVERTFKGTAEYTQATHDSFKAAAKLVIGRRDPVPDTYDTDVFKLSSRRATVVRNQRARMKDFIDKSKPWPTIVEYTNPYDTQVPALVRLMGLRVGPYSVWHGTGAGDRDAHHAVQYLLFEYFRNGKKRKPFPLLGSVPYPGVSATGALVSTIYAAGTQIKVAEYEKNRGGKVPTIFLARHTHQSGIHLHTEAPDDDTSAPMSQVAAIDNSFSRNLGLISKAGPVMDNANDLKQLEQLRKQGKQDEPLADSNPPITFNRVATAIGKATQQTYKDMWTDLKPRLWTAVRTQEVAYYNAILKQRDSSAIQLSSNDVHLAAAFQAIADQTESEIGTAAGFGPGFKAAKT